jgi:hypothetical protein
VESRHRHAGPARHPDQRGSEELDQEEDDALVQASEAGVTDSTPATDTWKVKKKKK